MDIECNFCILREDCPGYYAGCYEAVNHRSKEEVYKEIDFIDKAIGAIGATHLFSKEVIKSLKDNKK